MGTRRARMHMRTHARTHTHTHTHTRTASKWLTSVPWPLICSHIDDKNLHISGGTDVLFVLSEWAELVKQTDTISKYAVALVGQAELKTTTAFQVGRSWFASDG